MTTIFAVQAAYHNRARRTHLPRLARCGEFVEALSRVAAGGTALDAEVVTQLLGASRRPDGLGSLTAREHDVLALMPKAGPTARSPGFS